MTELPKFPVEGGCVQVEYYPSKLRRALIWISSALVIRTASLGEPLFIVIRDRNGGELYREGPYYGDLALREAGRYAEHIKLIGMDKAMRSIRLEMRAGDANSRPHS